MKSYALTCTALSPLHIGTGEDFEPTNYVILADEKGKFYLYEFDEVAFYKALSAQKKEEFKRIVSDTSAYARFKLYGFIVDQAQTARKVAHRKIQVLQQVAKEYQSKIGKVVQREGKGKKVFNSFRIAKTFTTPNKNVPIIPGSSLKGSISTAYQEELYKQLKSYKEVQKRMLQPSEENLFRYFIISDAIPIKHGSSIAKASNFKRNSERSNQMSTYMHTISPTSIFTTRITLKHDEKGKEVLDFHKIAKACNAHYLPIFKSQFNYATDEYTRKMMDEAFIANYEQWQPSEGEFLLRVGKHSGARANTIEGLREIKIMQGRRSSRNSDEETTVWMRGGGSNDVLLPFGWLLCSFKELA